MKNGTSSSARNLSLKTDQIRIAFSFIRKFLYNWIRVKTGNDVLLEPLFALYLITKRCNFRCGYCYAESNERISAVSPDDLDYQKTVELLTIMRKDVENIYFSGGEPLLRSDIVNVLRTSRALKFHTISLTTNGILLPKKPEVADYLDYLAVSLDTLDEAKNDAMSGVRAGTTQKIIGIIREFAGMQKEKNFSFLINAVITEDNIPAIYPLMG